MEHLGRRASTPGAVYLVGGATALMLGIRPQTIDIDIKLDPEPQGAFEAIAELKESLGVNVELAAPDQFIPPLPGWRERSPFVAAVGPVVFRHYDLYSQVLAKIERGHQVDRSDAEALVERGRLDVAELVRLAQAIRPQMARYPALDPADFERKLREFVDTYVDAHAEREVD